MSKSIIRSIKNVTNGYSPIQIRVRNATSNDPYGPADADKAALASMTYDPAAFTEIMDMLARRLSDPGKYWHHIRKSLIVIEYLLVSGSMDVVDWVRNNIAQISTLKEFVHRDEEGRDQSSIIRAKAKEICELVADSDRLTAERTAAADQQRRHFVPSPAHYAPPGYPPPGHRSSPPAVPPRTRTGGSVLDDSADPYLREVLEESRRTAVEDEARREATVHESEDNDLRRAIELSEEEARREQALHLTQVQTQPTAAMTYTPFQTQAQSHQLAVDASTVPKSTNTDLLVDIFGPAPTAMAASKSPFASPFTTAASPYSSPPSQASLAPAASASPFAATNSQSPQTTSSVPLHQQPMYTSSPFGFPAANTTSVPQHTQSPFSQDIFGSYLPQQQQQPSAFAQPSIFWQPQQSPFQNTPNTTFAAFQKPATTGTPAAAPISSTTPAAPTGIFAPTASAPSKTTTSPFGSTMTYGPTPIGAVPPAPAPSATMPSVPTARFGAVPLSATMPTSAATPASASAPAATITPWFGGAQSNTQTTSSPFVPATTSHSPQTTFSPPTYTAPTYSAPTYTSSYASNLVSQTTGGAPVRSNNPFMTSPTVGATSPPPPSASAQHHQQKSSINDFSLI
ncbi:uncharacterized protein V1518DRAFT_416288 [Limtongia smithiae]|uniref:uncharacterized protein n=1 Tax=Limtongia smithiae TaxID=1125753 RepID=UPI0034D00030